MNFYRFIWWIAYGICVLLFRVRVEGRTHISREGGIILAGNHCSYADPVIIGVAAGRELWYVTKSEVFPVPFLGELIRKLHAMPVQRGRGDRGALVALEEVLKSGGGVFIFPEGTRNKNPGFLPPKPGVGMVAYRTKVPVVPVYVSGTVNVWKTMLGLDRVTVRFGPALHFCPDHLPGRRKDAYHSISKEVMHTIGNLGESDRSVGTVAPAPRYLWG